MVERVGRAARAAQQLCDTLWEALHDELRDPNAVRIRELSVRLGEVSSTVALLASGDFDAVALAEEPAAPVAERRTPPTQAEPPPADPRTAPEMIAVREQIRSWRFYDHFRTDSESPVRLPQIGTHTPVLSDDGFDLG